MVLGLSTCSVAVNQAMDYGQVYAQAVTSTGNGQLPPKKK